MAVDIGIAHLREGRHLTATFFGPWCDVPAQRRDRSS